MNLANKSKNGLTHYGKAILVALCAILFTVCFSIVAISMSQGTRANFETKLQSNEMQPNNATPRVAGGSVNFTVNGGSNRNGVLEYALSQINSGSYGTISLYQNVEHNALLSDAYFVRRNTTIYLGGYTLSLDGGWSHFLNIAESANLTVEGSGTITNRGGYTGDEGYCLYNTGSGLVTINNARIESSNRKGAAIANHSTNGGRVLIQSGSIIEGSGGSKGIINITGTTTVSGGLVTSTQVAILSKESGTVNINGGTVRTTGSSNAVYCQSYASVNFTGGTISAGDGGNGIYNTSPGAVNIRDSAELTITTGSGIYNPSSGNINISGGTLSATTGYVVFNNSSATVNITGGTVSTTQSTTDLVSSVAGTGVYNASNGTVSVNGGKVTAINASSTAIFNGGSGTINVQSGELSHRAKAVTASSISLQALLI